MDGSTNEDHISSQTPSVKAGLYLGTVVANLDTTYMGVLQVQLQRPTGGNTTAGQIVNVKYASPFFGSTGEEYVSDVDDYENTQKSYGMWMVPPDTGTTVIVAFTNNDTKYGYWIACVPDLSMNFMVPGLAATKFISPDSLTVDGKRVPVAEYNKKYNPGTQSDPTKINKAQHPFAKILELQGLLKDDVRGITTSGARRESPSNVFGISTPGPSDKRSGAKRGPVGKEGERVNNFPVSRMGGTTFVMDDGDDKFLRKTLAGEGPPEYASVEQKETDGDITIPHNELFRIRTRTGHQILLHNSEDLIYIGNASGTSWIELTSNGKIDIYAKDSISIHTEEDINFTADRDINFEAKRDINMKSGNNFQLDVKNNFNVVVTADGKITTTGNLDVNSKGHNWFTAGLTTEIKSGGNHIETATEIHMNGPDASAAVDAVPLKEFTVPVKDGTTAQSIMLRVPQAEPWAHHENLDPINFTPISTDITKGAEIPTPKAWNEYSIKTDTFEKFLPPEPAPGDQA
jgi:hypothetical protein